MVSNKKITSRWLKKRPNKSSAAYVADKQLWSMIRRPFIKIKKENKLAGWFYLPIISGSWRSIYFFTASVNVNCFLKHWQTKSLTISRCCGPERWYGMMTYKEKESDCIPYSSQLDLRLTLKLALQHKKIVAKICMIKTGSCTRGIRAKCRQVIRMPSSIHFRKRVMQQHCSDAPSEVKINSTDGIFISILSPSVLVSAYGSCLYSSLNHQLYNTEQENEWNH